MFKLYFVLFNCIVYCSAAEYNIKCTEEFCEQQRKDRACEDKVPSGCMENGAIVMYPTPCNCCNYCIAYLDEGAECQSDIPSEVLIERMCGPGLKCISNTCQKMPENSSKCVNKQFEFDNEENNFAHMSWRPVCDSEGDFGPVHCIPSSICYCIEPYNGTRIFGESLYISDNMEYSCSCSVAAWKAKTYLGLDADFFRCLPNGKYDQLQCIDGECMCVDENTAEPYSSKRVHESELKEGALSCFDKTLHPEGHYEKSCELELKMKLEEIVRLNSKGIELLFTELPSCTEDGNYHRVQRKKRNEGFRCVDPLGNLIRSYEGNNGTSDCNCARTQWLLEEAGIPELPTCNNDGTYQAWQCWRDKCYCVDCNGNQISEHTTYSERKNLDCYYHPTCRMLNR